MLFLIDFTLCRSWIPSAVQSDRCTDRNRLSSRPRSWLCSVRPTLGWSTEALACWRRPSRCSARPSSRRPEWLPDNWSRYRWARHPAVDSISGTRNWRCMRSIRRVVAVETDLEKNIYKKIYFKNAPSPPATVLANSGTGRDTRSQNYRHTRVSRFSAKDFCAV